MPTLNVKTTKDDVIINNGTGQYYNTQNYLYIGKQAAGSTRALLFFDLSTIPAYSIINTATLNLRLGGSVSNSVLVFDAHRITGAWTEYAVTWADQPAFNPTPGAPSLSCPYSPSSVWKQWSITSLIQECIDNTYTGILLKAQNENATDNPKLFFGREYGDTTTAYLDIDYTETGLAKVWNGSSWVRKPVKVWNGSAWVNKPMKRWNGSAWVNL